MAAPATGGLGALLTLHHVRPARKRGFDPNGLLEITPEFLDAVLGYIRRAGFEFVDLEEAGRRLAAGTTTRRFVCLTFDDGYRDNMAYAQPILRRHNVPWTLFVTTAFADQRGELWWLALEDVIARSDRVVIDLGEGEESFDCRTDAAKGAAYDAIYWRLRAMSEPQVLGIVRGLAERNGIDTRSFCRELCMDWDELDALSDDPLVTFGAHTVTHPRLATLTGPDAATEMRESRTVIERRLDRPVTTFAYPVGDLSSAGPREFHFAAGLGFRLAVTTRPGVLKPSDAQAMHSLPRISLNGRFQKLRYVGALLSGLPFASLRDFRAAGRT
ncbi:polysaccharide deacetylase family protein [Bosea sp. 117]|uniref:polysaccharide deacetylase family protein n=1 Tax=Bosea sp. 117 TaxID=1125973 RepID=UPI0020C0B0C8|nr:polysaccharide deacetylase family protein [Bosea sp. 117]